MKFKKKIKRAFKQILGFLPKFLKYPLYRSLVRLPASCPQDVIFKIAETRQELEAAFKLLHDSYVEVGLMKPDSSGLRVTPYHALPSSITIIGKHLDEVVATLTIIRDSPLGLPSDQFVDLKKLRVGGSRIAEISALSIKPQYRGQLLFFLLKHMYEWCIHYLGVDHLIAVLTTDSKSHELYESILFFKPIEGKVESNYSFANFRPVIAEHLDLNQAPALFDKAYGAKKSNQNLISFFEKAKIENLKYPSRKHFQVDYPVMNLELFKYFFIEKTSALINMSEIQFEKLRKSFEGHLLESFFKVKSKESSKVVRLRKRMGSNLRFNVSLKAAVFDEQGQLKIIHILDISKQGLRISSKFQMPDSFMIVAPFKRNQVIQIQVKKVWETEEQVYGLKVEQANQNWLEMLEVFHHSHAFQEVRNYKKAG